MVTETTNDAGKPGESARRMQPFAGRSDQVTAGLLINPTSRRNRKHLAEIVQLAESCPHIHYFITDEATRVSAGLSFLASSSVDILVISGGDGTISEVFTHLLGNQLFDSLPPIIILPGGTANMTGGDVGLTGDVLKTLRRLCDWLESRPYKADVLTRPILRVQPGSNTAARYGMFFGAGAIVQGINYTNQNIHSRGMKNELSLGLGLIRSMWGISKQDPRFFEPTSMTIASGGQSEGVQQSITLLLVSSLERLFLNMHPYWGEDNGKPLHVSVVGNPAQRFLRSLPSVLRGKPSRHMTPDNGYVSYNVDTISLGFDGPFTLDGEIMIANIDHGPVEISNGGELVFLKI